MSDSGSAESRPASAQDSYIVERIEAKRRNRRNGVMEYFIKWKNFPVSENSWEPEENCQECEEAIADFERREAEKRAMKRAAARNRGRGSALSAPATPAAPSAAAPSTSGLKKPGSSLLKYVDDSDSASTSTTASRNQSVVKETPTEAQGTPDEVEEVAQDQNEALPEPIAEEAMEVTEEFAPAVKKTPKAKATIPALFDEDISKTVKKKATKKRIEELVEEADIDNISDSSYGVSKGATVKAIVGVSNLRPTEIMVIVQYTNGECEAVPSRLLKNHCSHMLIDFYESKLNFRDIQD